MTNYGVNEADSASHGSVQVVGNSSAVAGAAAPAVVSPPTLVAADLGLKARNQAYIHPSWLAKALVGDRQCLASLHTQANFVFRRVDGDFDAESYKVKHQGRLVKYAQELRDAGYTVYTENSNSFKVPAGKAVISGTPDIVATRGEEVLVVDIKTGKPRASDQAQVLLYLLFIPAVGLHGIHQVPEGRLVYQDYKPVEVQSLAVTEDFKQQVRDLVAMMRSPELPPVTPSARECCYCPLRHICPYKVITVAEASVDWL
ncbi:PD-(D/E)XK nuclease family protein [Kamptonema cortianum]|nr:PD-(D/E)XK nuclease family protein [Kamptonema cortianum]